MERGVQYFYISQYNGWVNNIDVCLPQFGIWVNNIDVCLPQFDKGEVIEENTFEDPIDTYAEDSEDDFQDTLYVKKLGRVNPGGSLKIGEHSNVSVRNGKQHDI